MSAIGISTDIDVRFVANIAPRGLDKGAAIIAGHAAVFTNRESKKWQAAFAAIADQHATGSILDGPLRLDILAVLPRPQKYMRRKDPFALIWAPVKPDGDNIRKNVQDAMRTWWRDDKQVVCGQTIKTYASKTGSPCLLIRLRTLDGVHLENMLAQIFGGDMIAPLYAAGGSIGGPEPLQLSLEPQTEDTADQSELDELSEEAAAS